MGFQSDAPAHVLEIQRRRHWRQTILLLQEEKPKKSPSQHQWTDLSVDSEETLPDIIHGFDWIDCERCLLPTVV